MHCDFKPSFPSDDMGSTPRVLRVGEGAATQGVTKRVQLKGSGTYVRTYRLEGQ